MLGPVFYQEMLLGGRRNQLHVFRWIYAGWLVFQIGGLYFFYLMYETAHQFDPTGYTASSAPEIVGSWFTRMFLYQQMVLLILATPALVAGAVADEKRRGTLQYLLLASLDTRHILLGKLFGRSAQVALLMIAGLPLYALFAGFSFAYGRTWIELTPGGVVAATPFRVRPVPFAEIERIVVQDGLAGRAYAVVTRRGLIRFSCLFDHHRELFEALLERSGLSRV